MMENEKSEQYLRALANGNLDEVLSLRKKGFRVAESPDDFSIILANLIECNSLGQLNSRQINPLY